MIDKLCEFGHLAIRQRIHRIDNYRARAAIFARCAGSYGGLNDRNEEAERFARTRSCRYDKALTRDGLCNRLRLMPMQTNSFSLNAENLCRVRR